MEVLAPRGVFAVEIGLNHENGEAVGFDESKVKRCGQREHTGGLCTNADGEHTGLEARIGERDVRRLAAVEGYALGEGAGPLTLDGLQLNRDCIHQARPCQHHGTPHSVIGHVPRGSEQGAEGPGARVILVHSTEWVHQLAGPVCGGRGCGLVDEEVAEDVGRHRPVGLVKLAHQLPAILVLAPGGCDGSSRHQGGSSPCCSDDCSVLGCSIGPFWCGVV